MGSSGGSSRPQGYGATAAAPSTTAGGHPGTVGTAVAGGLGTILVDAQGRTLYLFEKDTGTKSACFGACFGACASAWPPLRASGKPTAGSGANASMMLGTTPRSDGKPQVTYNGHPLYTYTADQNPGDTSGEGLTGFGGLYGVRRPLVRRLGGR